MGPTTDTTPGPQAGAMLDRDLQPPTSTLEGDGPRSLTESPQAERQTGQRLQRQQRGLERGGGESGKPSWGGSGRITEGWERVTEWGPGLQDHGEGLWDDEGVERKC